MEFDLQKLKNITDNTNLTKYIYNEIKTKILHWELMPGDKISEVEVATMLNLSRTPVREAFKQLCHDKMLESKPQRGTFVPYIDLEQAQAAYFVRTSLECGVIEICIKNNSLKNEFTSMQKLIDKQEKLLEKSDIEAYHPIDEDFHHYFYHFSKQCYVKDLADSAYMQCLRLRFMCMKNDPSPISMADEHQQILDAVINADCEEAKKAMQFHINKNLQNILTDDSYISLRKFLI